jgi:hypothetical protein
MKMTEPTPDNAITRILATDPADVGCTETLELLDVYADMVRSGMDPESRFPGIAAHLRECPPCSEDLEGLLASLREDLLPPER